MTPRVTSRDILDIAVGHLKHLSGHVFNVMSIEKPISIQEAVNLAKIISKLSPFVGNQIEIRTVELLNKNPKFAGMGTWKRQDPDFPDTIFKGNISPEPGIEIKAWFPPSTEITGRFKDSQNRFKEEGICVALVAWVPEMLVYGAAHHRRLHCRCSRRGRGTRPPLPQPTRLSRD